MLNFRESVWGFIWKISICSRYICDYIVQPWPAAANENYGNEHSLTASSGIEASVYWKKWLTSWAPISRCVWANAKNVIFLSWKKQQYTDFLAFDFILNWPISDKLIVWSEPQSRTGQVPSLLKYCPISDQLTVQSEPQIRPSKLPCLLKYVWRGAGLDSDNLYWSLHLT